MINKENKYGGYIMEYLDINLLTPTQRLEDTCRRQLRGLTISIANKYDERFPIQVIEEGGEYYIGNGHHRYLACIWAGVQIVPIEILSKERFVYDSVEHLKSCRKFDDRELEKWYELIDVLQNIDYTRYDFSVKQYIKQYKNLIESMNI